MLCILQNQQRELTVRHAKETEKEMKKRLDVQKDEYEETIKRHLSFIDQVHNIFTSLDDFQDLYMTVFGWALKEWDTWDPIHL